MDTFANVDHPPRHTRITNPKYARSFHASGKLIRPIRDRG